MRKFVVRQLATPDLDEVASVIDKALKTNFKNASAVVTACPDLSQAPYSLAAKGLGGKTGIADVGGVINMEYIKNNNKYHYDLKLIGADMKLPFFIGAAATLPSVATAKDNSELIPNANISTGLVLSKEAYVKDTKCCSADYPSTEFSSLGNFFGSEGLPDSKVIRFHAHVRTGTKNPVSIIREALKEHFGPKKAQVGLGGVFLIKQGKFKSHVMDGFPPCDVYGKPEIPWLKFYETEAPATCLSVLVSEDLHDDSLRLEHTHFFTTREDGGHYHYDTTPETVEYEGFYAIATQLYRVDRAEVPQ